MTIPNFRFSLEVHLVHWKTSYGSFATAKTKADGLAVLAILFKADHDNHEYEALEVCTPFIKIPFTILSTNYYFNGITWLNFYNSKIWVFHISCSWNDDGH